MKDNGTIKFFNKTKGFGFITPEEGGKDVFVHATGLDLEYQNPKEGDSVTYEVSDGKKGPQATSVELA
jgi:CspA family cold shock protein